MSHANWITSFDVKAAKRQAMILASLGDPVLDDVLALATYTGELADDE